MTLCARCCQSAAVHDLGLPSSRELRRLPVGTIVEPNTRFRREEPAAPKNRLTKSTDSRILTASDPARGLAMTGLPQARQHGSIARGSIMPSVTRIILAAAVISLSLLLSAASSPVQADPPPTLPRDLDTTLRKLETQIAEVRGLKFKSPITAEVVPQRAVAASSAGSEYPLAPPSEPEAMS